MLGKFGKHAPEAWQACAGAALTLGIGVPLFNRYPRLWQDLGFLSGTFGRVCVPLFNRYTWLWQDIGLLTHGSVSLRGGIGGPVRSCFGPRGQPSAFLGMGSFCRQLVLQHAASWGGEVLCTGFQVSCDFFT